MQVSYSDITRYQRCPKSHYYATVLEIQPKVIEDVLTIGQAAHQGLMNHYLGLVNVWDDESYDTQNLVERYLDYYRDDDWTILHVEETFQIELDTGDIITVTPDLVVQENATGAVWIVDHKTTDRMPSDNAEPSLQALTYFGLLKTFFPTLTGFIFNYLRKKPPAQPRLTKTGPKRVAYLDTIDTTYEILRDFLMDEAPDLLDDPAHKMRLATLRDENRFFVRQYVYITDAMIENTIEDIQTTLSHMQYSSEFGYHRVFLPYAGPQSCNRCPFKEVCLAELRGYNTEPILEALYEPRDMSHKDYDYQLEELHDQSS